MKIDNGIAGLLASKKGTLSLLMLACATAAVLLGKIDGISYAAVVTTVSSVFMWTQHKTDMALGGNIHTEGRNE